MDFNLDGIFEISGLPMKYVNRKNENNVKYAIVFLVRLARMNYQRKYLKTRLLKKL